MLLFGGILFFILAYIFIRYPQQMCDWTEGRKSNADEASDLYISNLRTGGIIFALVGVFCLIGFFFL